MNEHENTRRTMERTRTAKVTMTEHVADKQRVHNASVAESRHAGAHFVRAGMRLRKSSFVTKDRRGSLRKGGRERRGGKGRRDGGPRAKFSMRTPNLPLR